ncbi:MAG: RNA polymerase sigma factor [Terriglobia bacterium]
MPANFDNETILIEKGQRGDPESLIALARLYEQRVYRLGYALTLDAHDAEEVLQETLLKACENIGQFSGEPQFHIWLVQIAVNEALVVLRQRQTPFVDSPDVPADADKSLLTPRDFGEWRENPQEGYTRGELNWILSKGLFQLEARLRLVFVLRDMEGLSLEDTASILGISTENAGNRLLNARLKLREALSTWFKDASVLTDRAGGEGTFSDLPARP